MSSFLVLCEGDTRNRWRDGQVCPDVGQGTMAPWARRPEKRGEKEGDGKREEKESGEREEPALDGEKGLVRDWSGKTMNAGGVEK
ncbi:hypothetical protein TNCV_2697841 [Trichonephila clavipes]|nr:hypothetical protein TNCV_2697841 [Trichonephila clavipes]